MRIGVAHTCVRKTHILSTKDEYPQWKSTVLVRVGPQRQCATHSRTSQTAVTIPAELAPPRSQLCLYYPHPAAGPHMLHILQMFSTTAVNFLDILQPPLLLHHTHTHGQVE